MKLVRWNASPWQSLDLFHDELDRFFDLSFKGSWPSVDISEDKENIYVEADLPGFEQKDINATLKKDSLVIAAKKEESRRRRNFYREVRLPAGVKHSQVKAAYKNGVLKLTLPKAEEEKAQDIRIE